MSQRPGPPQTPPSARKQLKFLSPQHKSPRGKKEDIVGYVLSVGCEQQGATNCYIDIQMNLANKENRFIRVMRMGLQTDFMSHLNKPVKLSSVTPPVPTDRVLVWLYNEKFGSSCEPLTHSLPYPMIPLRFADTSSLTLGAVSGFAIKGYLRWLDDGEDANNSWVKTAVLRDNSGRIPVCVWKRSLVNATVERYQYIFTDMSTSLYKGVLRANTTAYTVIMRVNDENLPNELDISEYIEEKPSAELNNADIVSVMLTESKLCRFKKCGKVFDPPPPEDDPLPKCPSCGNKTAKKNLIEDRNMIIIVDVDDDDLELTVTDEVLKNTELRNLKGENLENQMLMMTNFSIQYNPETNVITAIHIQADAGDEELQQAMEMQDNNNPSTSSTTTSPGDKEATGNGAENAGDD